MPQIMIWKPGDELPILDWITEDIAVGSVAQAESPEILRAEGVKAIVSIGKDAPKTELSHRHFPDILDNQTFMKLSDGQIEEVLKAIAEARQHGKVLVHCAAGVSRSPGFTALYISYSNNMSFWAALELVKEHRSVAAPMPWVLTRLSSYRRDHSSPVKIV